MKRLLLLCLAILLAGCAGQSINQYQQAQPTLDPLQFFQGRTQAWGMFQSRSGEVVKRFTVELTGTIKGDQLTLDEAFRYSDGSRQQRTWTLQRHSDGSWRGSAADVVGEARGELAGNALNWRYTLRLPVDGSEYLVNFDDWMYLIDAHTMVNRASMSKFGVELGQVTLFFRKDPS
ncbi:DUF3833 domain-containing protein [Chitinimonas sp.]|uniref:DUF3833 domain-containing protein n=1 Tax=Chitinimonas sp. TaxID=1934313 RepID=UPI0035B28277